VSAELQYPVGATLPGLVRWAQSIVNVLRRQDTQRVEDDTNTFDALAAYAEDVQSDITAAGGVAQSVFNQYEAAAAAGHAKLASHYLTQAANTVEQTVRIEEASVTAERIDTVAAYLAGSSATITDIETAVANGDTAIATRISNVQTQANGNSTSIQTITSSAGGTDANYALVANSNGHIKAGFVLSTGVAGSNITFLADKFIVANPSSSGNVITPFVVGLVNGSSTVAINGSLVVDGTIIARHIAAGVIDASKLNVSSLSAITANVGTVTAGVIQSSNGKVVLDLNAGTFTITS
jgi:hypothetical protein